MVCCWSLELKNMANTPHWNMQWAGIIILALNSIYRKAMLYNSISASCVPMAYFWVLQKINQHDVSLEKTYSHWPICRNSCCFLKPDRIGQKLAENLEVEKRSIHGECVKVCIFFSSILCIDNRIKLSWMKRIMLLNFSLWWLWKSFFFLRVWWESLIPLRIRIG